MAGRVLEIMTGGRIPVELGSVTEVRLLQLLGTGGFGSVWKAEDPATNQLYVLKIIRFNAKPDETTIKRVHLEAGVSIVSEHVIPTIGLREWDAVTFLILFEYFEGQALDDLIASGKLTDDQKKTIYDQMLVAVADIHKSNIIHRDLKPANFIVSRDWQLKLIDFGISKFSKTAITHDNMIMGTLPYLAPESIKDGSKFADAKVDIYALGHILYELVMGKSFWSRQGWDRLEDLVDFLNLIPTPMEIIRMDGFKCNFYPRAVDVLPQMVKVEPAERFASVNDVMDALGITRKRFEPVIPPLSIPFLIVESGTNRGALIPVNVPDLGRSEYGRTDVAGNDDSISRRHVEFTRCAAQYFVRDLGSKNKTLLNGTELNPGDCPKEIQHGDRIKLGDIFLRFEFLRDG